MTSIITRHLSDHHAVQGEAEYVERHAPEIGRVAPAMTQVRPLKWEDWSSQNRTNVTALTDFGRYAIIQLYFPEMHYKIEPPQGKWLSASTLEAAKAAAQADYERRILAALTSSPGWQPIETAPRDGTRVLFWLADEGFPCLASWRKWDGYEGFYLWEMGDFADHNLPTHWMPLPAAPEAEGGSHER